MNDATGRAKGALLVLVGTIGVTLGGGFALVALARALGVLDEGLRGIDGFGAMALLLGGAVGWSSLGLVMFGIGMAGKKGVSWETYDGCDDMARHVSYAGTFWLIPSVVALLSCGDAFAWAACTAVSMLCMVAGARCERLLHEEMNERYRKETSC